MMYILKIKGTQKIPNFVQIRDENLSLKAYFRADQVEKGLQKNKIDDKSGEIQEIIQQIPFGKIFKFEKK